MAGDNVIDDSVVRVSPDLTGFRTKLRADVKTASEGVEAKVKLIADGTGFAATARTALRGKNLPTGKVQLVADATGWAASVRKALATKETPTGKVKLVADISHFDRSLREALKDYSVHVKVKVERDRSLDEALNSDERSRARSEDRQSDIVRRGERQRSAIRRNGARNENALLKASRAEGIIDLGGSGIRPMNLLIGAAVALSPALLSVASSAAFASTSVAALGAASIGTAGAVTAIVVGFTRIRDALTLRTQVRKEEQRSTVDTIANARAERDRARTVVVANHALRDSIRAVADARRRLNDVEANAAEARKGVNLAFKEAAQHVRDLREELSDLALQEQQDTLDVAGAKQRLAEVNDNYWATDLERRQAALDVQKAIDRQGDTKREKRTKGDELTKLDKGGPEVSPQVIEARKRVAEANRAVEDARRDVKYAQERVLDAQVKSTEAKVADTTASKKATAASQDLAAAIAAMSPAARKMYFWFRDNETMLDKLRSKMEQAILPGFLTFLKQITDRRHGKSSLDIMADSAARLGKSVADTSGRLGAKTKTGWFRGDLKKINTENEKSFALLGKAAETVLRPLSRITAAAAPLFTRFSRGVLDLSKQFDAFIEKHAKDGSLKKFFKDAGTEAGKWFTITGKALAFVRDIFTAALPSGQGLTTRIKDAVTQLQAWSSSTEGQASIKRFFDFFKDLDYARIGAFVTNVATLITSLKLFTFAREHPFLAILTLLASHDLDGTDKLIENLGRYLTETLKWVEEHPKSSALILAVLTAAKNAKSVSIGLKLLGLGGLTDKIAGLFGKAVATMTVNAGAVYVNGGVGGVPGAPGAPPAGKNLVREVGKGLIVSAVVIAADDALKESGWTKNLPGMPEQARLEKGLADLQKERDATPKGYPLPSEMALGANKAASGAAARFQDFIKKHGGDLSELSREDGTQARRLFDEYVRTRKEAVKYAVEVTRIRVGEKEAQALLTQENQKTKDAVAAVYEAYGVGKGKAQEFADVATGGTLLVGESADRAKARVDKLNGEMDKATAPHDAIIAIPGVKDREAELKNVNAQIDKIVGTKTATVIIKDDPAVGKKLLDLLSMQYALSSGLSLETSSAAVRKDQARTLRGKYATGGKVDGYSPNSRADNIPAMLTANEYVQPVAAVKHYGTDMMDAIRTRTFPRFADGGSVQRWPFTVNATKTKTDFAAPFELYTGKTVGSLDVARIAEAQARAMGASDKQLLALIEAGVVESGMRNLNFGDRDSLGFLQQRAGWGSPKERMNVAVATSKFIRSAKQKDRKRYTAGELAQAVQVSGRPLAYDRRELDAYNIINKEAPGIGSFGNVGTPAGFPPWPRHAGAGPDSGVWHNIVKLIKSSGIHSGSFGNAYRKGDSKWHGSGHAVDWMGFGQDALASWLAARNPLELIHRTKKRDYAYTRGKDKGSFNEKLMNNHKNHIHIAMADGGLVPNVPIKTYDSGGGLAPGVTLAVNGTGRTETIRTHEQEKALQGGPQRLDKRDLALLAQYITAASARPIHMDGRKVAEIVNSYSYVHGGV